MDYLQNTTSLCDTRHRNVAIGIYIYIYDSAGLT